jgi:hypothetical protein
MSVVFADVERLRKVGPDRRRAGIKKLLSSSPPAENIKLSS